MYVLKNVLFSFTILFTMTVLTNMIFFIIIIIDHVMLICIVFSLEKDYI